MGEMIIHTNLDIKDYNIKTELRLNGKSSRFAPEIYLMAGDFQLYALHSPDVKSGHRFFLEEWPTPEFWQEIFYLNGIHDDYAFCCYADRIAHIPILRENPEHFHVILQSFGYSPSRFNDIAYTAALTGYKKELFIQKKIPVKLLRLLNDSPDSGLDDIAGYLLLKEVNGNICKEIISSWIDLNVEQKEKVLQQFSDIIQIGSSSTNRQTGDELRRAIHFIRYPEISKLQAGLEIERFKLPKNLRVDFDINFERNGLKIFTEVENEKQIEEFIKSIQEKRNISILEQLIKLLNPT